MTTTIKMTEECHEIKQNQTFDQPINIGKENTKQIQK